MGAEFVRGRVCQGPSLLGAEMSRNPVKQRNIRLRGNGNFPPQEKVERQ